MMRNRDYDQREAWAEHVDKVLRIQAICPAAQQASNYRPRHKASTFEFPGRQKITNSYPEQQVYGKPIDKYLHQSAVKLELKVYDPPISRLPILPFDTSNLFHRTDRAFENREAWDDHLARLDRIYDINTDQHPSYYRPRSKGYTPSWLEEPYKYSWLDTPSKYYSPYKYHYTPTWLESPTKYHYAPSYPTYPTHYPTYPSYYNSYLSPLEKKLRDLEPTYKPISKLQASLDDMLKPIAYDYAGKPIYTRGGWRRPLSELFEPSIYTPISRIVRDPWWYSYPELRPFVPHYDHWGKSPFYMRTSYLSPVKNTFIWGQHPLRPFSGDVSREWGTSIINMIYRALASAKRRRYYYY